MGVFGADNPLWLEMLEWGPDAPHAGWFDIEWDPERRYLHNKVLVPLLGDQYGIELERGVLRLKFDRRAREASRSGPTRPTSCRSGHPTMRRFSPRGRRAGKPRRCLRLAAELARSDGAARRRAQGAAGRRRQCRRVRRREALQASLARFEGRDGDAGSWQELRCS